MKRPSLPTHRWELSLSESPILKFGGEKRIRDRTERYQWVDLSSLPHPFLWDWDFPRYLNRLPPFRVRIMVCDRGGCLPMRNPRGISQSGRLYLSFLARIGTRRLERSRRGQSLRRNSSKWSRPRPGQAQRLFGFSFSRNYQSWLLFDGQMGIHLVLCWVFSVWLLVYVGHGEYMDLQENDVFLFEKEWNVTNNQAVL